MKRYVVTSFPDPTGTWGNPYRTNWWILAYWEAYRRWDVILAEVRIKDNKTGKEIVW